MLVHSIVSTLPGKQLIRLLCAFALISFSGYHDTPLVAQNGFKELPVDPVDRDGEDWPAF
ncbi:MAG: hypothetical protein R3C11_03025 [Planctomycetaceae bacterium]